MLLLHKNTLGYVNGEIMVWFKIPVSVSTVTGGGGPTSCYKIATKMAANFSRWPLKHPVV